MSALVDRRDGLVDHAQPQVCVVGLGYIGLPTAAALATRGVTVVGVDINENTVNTINSGRVPFVEPDLGVAVSGAVSLGRLRATLEVEPAEAIILAVPTPLTGDKSPDLGHIQAAATAIAPMLRKGNLVVLESTSPPGATLRLSKWLAALRPDLSFPHSSGAGADVNVAHCPERVLPGRIMIELVMNDRIIGGVSERCADRAADLYRVFAQGEIHCTDATTAELVKLSENAFRDVNIAFANELSMISDQLGVDVHEVVALANRHPRVGILQPGPGVGGHCIAVDPWFIVASAPEHARLIRTAREVNDAKPMHVVEEALRVSYRFKDPVIACLGLSYKADVDDLRESPALEIAHRLAEKTDGSLLVVEPHVATLPAALAETGARLVDLPTALGSADIVVLLVGHSAFRKVKRNLLRGKVIIDTRGIWR